MQLPVLVIAAIAAQALPALAGLAAWRRLSRGRVWIIAWSLFAIAGTAAQLAVSYSGRSNLWLSYLTAPVEGSLILMALAQWQDRPIVRRALVLAIPIALLVHLIVVLSLENTQLFSRAALPLYSLLGLAAALTTLVIKATDATDPIVRQDWFWVSVGLALYCGTAVALMPLARLLVGGNVQLVSRAWQVYAVVGVVSYAVIAVGMFCPREPQGAPAPT